MAIDLSVVIPAYNQAPLLPATVGSLLAQTLAPDAYEVIVVDDGSTDGTAGVLSKMQRTAPHLRVITLPANRGRSGSRNAGIGAAHGRIIIFVDSDIVVRRDFLAAHLALHEASGRHGGSAGIVSRGPVVPAPSPAEVPANGVSPFAASPAYLNTTNAGVPADALRSVGMFDEAFPGYGWEDFELGLRLKRLGLKRVFERRAVAFHVEPQPSVPDVSGDLRRETERAVSAAYFFRKHPVWETRLLIQATPVHHAAYWAQTAGGWLTPDTIVPVTARLRQAGWITLAALLYRGVLNRHYLSELERELQHA